MACANIPHRIWFSNSSYYGSNNACQELFIPVEAIDKKNPAGQTTAPSACPSLTRSRSRPTPRWAARRSMTCTPSFSGRSHRDRGGPHLPEQHRLPGERRHDYAAGIANKHGDNKHVEFSKTANPALGLIPAGSQVVINLTVVLDNTTRNAPGTQFINTATWQFGRLIDGVYYEPLPGEWGITPPMTIVGPDPAVPPRRRHWSRRLPRSHHWPGSGVRDQGARRGEHPPAVRRRGHRYA